MIKTVFKFSYNVPLNHYDLINFVDIMLVAWPFKLTWFNFSFDI